MRTLPLPVVVLFSIPLQASPGDPDASGPAGTRLIDLDGDGALDVLGVHADGTLHVRRNAGLRRFEDVVQELPRVVVTDVLCSDLDADGILDLYLVSPGADVALRGEGGGSFREATAEL